jgi:hypothetical protein
VLLSLNRAVDKALDKKRRLGQYAIVEENFKPRRLEPEEIGEYLERMEIHETMQKEIAEATKLKALAKAI